MILPIQCPQIEAVAGRDVDRLAEMHGHRGCFLLGARTRLTANSLPRQHEATEILNWQAARE